MEHQKQHLTEILWRTGEATYLLGEVELVDEYTLYNVNRNKLEKMLQHIFQDAQVCKSKFQIGSVTLLSRENGFS